MNLHDLITEFEAEFASLIARFRSHPDVQAAATSSAPAQPTAPLAIDYAAYASLTPYEIETLKFPNGLPPGWDWAAWSTASGKPDPRGQPSGQGKAAPASGFALVRGGPPLVNPVSNGVLTGPFAFNVPDGATSAKISVAGAPGGGWFSAVSYSVLRGSDTVIPMTNHGFAGTDGTELDLPLPPGDYTMPLSVNGPASGQQNLAVQYYP